MRDDDSRLNADIAEAFGEVFNQMSGHLDQVARKLDLPALCIKALHMLSTPMAMKELGQRFHCDPSFVTSIADMLASHGLGKREPDARDRRIKNLLLTPKGLALRERVERELFGNMPWAFALDAGERQELLRLLRKMAQAGPATSCDAAAGTAMTETGGQERAPAPVPAARGGHRAGEVK